jgi:hypothetical protein
MYLIKYTNCYVHDCNIDTKVSLLYQWYSLESLVVKRYWTFSCTSGITVENSKEGLINIMRGCGLYIQGVPGGKDLTSGECSLGQTIPI